MRPTLRRSCAACAKAKHSCDLRTPRCARCAKRGILCLYANEPLTRPTPGPSRDNAHPQTAVVPGRGPLSMYRFGSVDPFDSYPQTRLPRDHVQRLIHSFLNKIAFQYYPLDLNSASNPFLVSWWPLALGDPALFHVSLQTACLDEEMLAQKGFQASELLMADSVVLLRRKVGDSSLAVQDGTMNSVITLAAIEFGKGNVSVSEMHIKGVKRLVDMRGGINAVRQTSPLTARMVSWVSMLVMGHPQFATQDDTGIGDGIPPIPEWQLDPSALEKCDDFSDIGISDDVRNVFIRLRHVFSRARQTPLPSTRLHDLAGFVIHRLLSSAPDMTDDSTASHVTECLRCGITLYMFIAQGPTYFSHAVILNALVTRLMEHLVHAEAILTSHPSLSIWLVATGMVASSGTPNYQWFTLRAQALVTSLQLTGWDEIFSHLTDVLWLPMAGAEVLFRTHWDAVLGGGLEIMVSDVRTYAPLGSDMVGYI